MPNDAILERLAKHVKPFRITTGRGFRLKDFDPADTRGLEVDKGEATELLKRGTEWLAQEQELLYAQDRWSLLLIFQAMDAAGKDSTIKHVISGLNPQGCQVYSFKQPSAEELDHDFMWRHAKCFPERGRIGIFNRSYYEEVLVVRVHPELLEQQQKHWKFQVSDVRERRFWSRYMEAYEEAITATASKRAPWFVVPADHKWFTRLVVAGAIVQAVDELHLSYPRVSPQKTKELKAARAMLTRE